MANSKQQHQVPNTQSFESFRSIMMSTKYEDLSEQKDKESRACNIIIHGKEDLGNQEEDSKFVSELIEEVYKDIKPKMITRIGRQELNKKRPIKIIMSKEDEKKNIMGNLINLKGKEKYKGISITEDYTISERRMIKEFKTSASNKNLMEPENSNFVWKVRGTPKNGLVIKRFTKVRIPQQTQSA